MKPLLFIALGIALLFFTNPDIDKHRAAAYNKTQSDIIARYGISNASPSALEEAIKRHYSIKDYYLFSLSYSGLFADSPQQYGTLEGIGVLGKVFSVN